MSGLSTVVAVTLLAGGLGGAPAWAQEVEDSKPAPAKSEEKPGGPEAKAKGGVEAASAPGKRVTATLKVQLVISRFREDKKIGSLPYVVTATANGPRVRMRMGLDTPVPVLSMGRDAEGKARSYNYKNVGTSLDCTARDLGDGRYELQMTIENSTALADEKLYPEVATTGAPIFRRFETALAPVLRDGQSIQAIASTDPVSGEVVKIDVTMNVVK